MCDAADALHSRIETTQKDLPVESRPTNIDRPPEGDPTQAFDGSEGGGSPSVTKTVPVIDRSSGQRMAGGAVAVATLTIARPLAVATVKLDDDHGGAASAYAPTVPLPTSPQKHFMVEAAAKQWGASGDLPATLPVGIMAAAGQDDDANAPAAPATPPIGAAPDVSRPCDAPCDNRR